MEAERGASRGVWDATGPLPGHADHGGQCPVPLHDVHARGGTRRRDGDGTLDVRSQGLRGRAGRRRTDRLQAPGHRPYWGDGDDARIFLNSRDRLYAINAENGELDPDFGESGSILLTEGHGREVTRFEFDQTSPPVVFEDLVIVGSRVPDGVQRKFDPPGTVQAFDTRTGKRRWVFFAIPQSSDDFGADTWEDEAWRYTGHANVWGLMSLDAERGLLYVPTSTPSSDYWGGRRVGANLFAESLVALDARTGERKWHFQMVHHGVWDYDL